MKMTPEDKLQQNRAGLYTHIWECYDFLVSEHGFEAPELIRGKGYASCVAQDGVEVTIMPIMERYRVEVIIPLNYRVNPQNFGKNRFNQMSAIQPLFFGVGEFEGIVGEVISIVARGRGFAKFKKDLLDPALRPNAYPDFIDDLIQRVGF
ncbi:hypothetical protein ACFL1B_02765 [Nanoarchaeota archaeon]